jgi:hypothetical protein
VAPRFIIAVVVMVAVINGFGGCDASVVAMILVLLITQQCGVLSTVSAH